jgi:hypothetical protein
MFNNFAYFIRYRVKSISKLDEEFYNGENIMPSRKEEAR